MSLYGPSVQSIGALTGLIGAKREAQAARRIAIQRAAGERARIERSYEYLRVKNRLKRVKQGISMTSPVVQILEFQGEQDKQEAIAESVVEVNNQLQGIAAVEQGRKYASLIGMADPWLSYEQRQGDLRLANKQREDALRIRRGTDRARLDLLKEQNAFLRKQLSALAKAVPSGIR